VFGNAMGEIVPASDAHTRVTSTEAGITCIAVNPSGNKCAIAMDNEVTEKHFPASADSVRDSRTGQAPRKELCVSHMEYDHDGSHL